MSKNCQNNNRNAAQLWPPKALPLKLISMISRTSMTLLSLKRLKVEMKGLVMKKGQPFTIEPRKTNQIMGNSTSYRKFLGQ